MIQFTYFVVDCYNKSKNQLIIKNI